MIENYSTGKRLFRNWVCHPLCDFFAINERLDAVDDIYNSDIAQETLSSCLRKVRLILLALTEI